MFPAIAWLVVVYDSTSYTNSASYVGIISEALLIVPNLHGNLEKLRRSLSVVQEREGGWNGIIPTCTVCSHHTSEAILLLHMLLGKIAC